MFTLRPGESRCRAPGEVHALRIVHYIYSRSSRLRLALHLRIMSYDCLPPAHYLYRFRAPPLLESPTRRRIALPLLSSLLEQIRI